MPARPRETELIGDDAEDVDEEATRVHRRFVLAASDGHICPQEVARLLTGLARLADRTGRLAHRVTRFDRTMEEALGLLHNGRTERTDKLAARRIKDERAGHPLGPVATR